LIARSIESSLGREDGVAEIESEVHVPPVVEVVFGQCKADGADGGVIDQRRLGDVVPPLVGASCGRKFVVTLAQHGVESRAEEEVGHQVERGHDTGGDEAFGPEIGHVDHLGVLDGRVGRHGHARGAGGGEAGQVGDDGVEVEPDGEPAARGDVVVDVPREPSSEPPARDPADEAAGAGRRELVAAGDVDGRDGEVGAAAGIEHLVEGVALDLRPGAPGGEAGGGGGRGGAASQ